MSLAVNWIISLCIFLFLIYCNVTQSELTIFSVQILLYSLMSVSVKWTVDRCHSQLTALFLSGNLHL